MSSRLPHSLAKDEVCASSRLIRTSPQKLGLLASLIRGKSAMRSMQLLMFSRKRAAESVMKVLQSAIANGENNKGLDPEKLVVTRVEVGKSVVMKRWRPRARGRMGKYQRVWSALGIVLKQAVEIPESSPGSSPGAAAAPDEKAGG